MMNMDKKISSCSFTGHRNIPREHIASLTDLTRRAIDYAYSQGARDFYSGGAIGFDTLAAQQVIRFRLNHPDARLHLILPCKNQEAKWTAEQKEAYFYILSVADTVTYLADEYTDGCMKERNKELVKLADMLVAYSGRSYSGSAQTVRLGREKGIPVYNLYEECVKNEG